MVISHVHAATRQTVANVTFPPAPRPPKIETARDGPADRRVEYFNSVDLMNPDRCDIDPYSVSVDR